VFAVDRRAHFASEAGPFTRRTPAPYSAVVVNLFGNSSLNERGATAQTQKSKFEKEERQRNRMKLLSITALALSLLPLQARAQANWNPFAALPSVVGLFKKLDAKFDSLVTVENQSQLLRSVDKIRINTYRLEKDSESLLKSIPNDQPHSTQREAIRESIRALSETIREMRLNLRTFGADLRLKGKDGEVAESALSSGFDGKEEAVIFVTRELGKSWDENYHWDPKPLREKLEAGLKAVKAAQVAVTDFERKFSRFDEKKKWRLDE
jgi:hypothetical protein